MVIIKNYYVKKVENEHVCSDFNFLKNCQAEFEINRTILTFQIKISPLQMDGQTLITEKL